MAGNPLLLPHQAVAIGEELARKRKTPTPRPKVEPTPDEAIVVIVQVFVDFENAKRKEEGGEPMPEDEEKGLRTRITDFFSKVAEGAKTGASAVRTAKELESFFNQILPGG